MFFLFFLVFFLNYLKKNILSSIIYQDFNVFIGEDYAI